MKAGAVQPELAEDASAPDLQPELLPELKGPRRRCLVTGEIRPREELLRFAVTPDRVLVADLTGRLPGRGYWVTPEATTVKAALQKNVFSRAARQQVKIPSGFEARLAALLRQRLIDLVGFARRGGGAVCGFEKVSGLARQNRLAGLLIASDASADGRRKLVALAPAAPVIDALDSATLAGIFGEPGATVYAGIGDKTHVAGLLLAANRLKALQLPPV